MAQTEERIVQVARRFAALEHRELDELPPYSRSYYIAEAKKQATAFDAFMQAAEPQVPALWPGTRELEAVKAELARTERLMQQAHNRVDAAYAECDAKVKAAEAAQFRMQAAAEDLASQLAEAERQRDAYSVKTAELSSLLEAVKTALAEGM